MATTDYEKKAQFESLHPNTIMAMSHVMYYVDCHICDGYSDRSWVYVKAALKLTTYAMVIDNIITIKEDHKNIIFALINTVSRFSDVFPNWQKEYSFLYDLLYVKRQEAEKLISSIMHNASTIDIGTQMISLTTDLLEHTGDFPMSFGQYDPRY